MSSTDLAEREVLTPELVDGVPDTPAWDEDCAVCHAHHAQGPEGTGWNRLYCWRCGYNPDKPVTGFVTQAQPDWGKLVKDAVREAMFSEPQKLAEALTASLGPDGLMALARSQQEQVGVMQGGPGHGG